MAFNYTLVKYKDQYTLTNNQVGETLGYLLEKDVNCNSWETVTSGTLQPGFNTGNSVVLPITTDGNYRLSLTDETPSTVTVNIKYYLNLQKSTINDIGLVLCECDCSSCSDCNDCQTMLAAITKQNIYVSLSDLDYSTQFTTISDYLKCRINEDIQCVLNGEKYIGSAEIDDSLNLLLSLFYLTMYFTEFGAAADADEETYVNTKFDYNTISKCILKYGINISDIKALF